MYVSKQATLHAVASIAYGSYDGVRQHAARLSKSAIGVCDKQQEHLVDVGFLLETN